MTGHYQANELDLFYYELDEELMTQDSTWGEEHDVPPSDTNGKRNSLLLYSDCPRNRQDTPDASESANGYNS